MQDIVIGRSNTPIDYDPNKMAEIATTEFMMRSAGRLEEGARIRTELINWIESLPNPATVRREHFLAQLDRICPR